MSEDQVVLPRRPSIADVALRAGVSRAAVSKVIRNAYGVSPDMRRRVEATISELGYRPRVAARAMRGASFTIGLQIPHIGNDFFSQIVEGATTGLAASGYQLIIAPGLGYRNEPDVLNALVDRQVDGIIAIPDQTTVDRLERLAEQVPVVAIGRHDHARAYDTVCGDDRAGIDLVMDHLLGLGHRRITHVTLPSLGDRTPHAIRAAGYRSRILELGREPQIVRTHTADRGSYEATQALLASDPPPTAIVAGHDTLAVDVLRAVADAGLDAQDVSVVGYDNIELARHPLVSLTTVDQFGVSMGMAAIELLMERIRDGRTSPTYHRVDPELRVRGSSRPPRVT